MILIIGLLNACSFTIRPPGNLDTITVSSFSVANNQLTFTGTSLDTVQTVTSSDASLMGYSFAIANQSPGTLTLSVSHGSTTPLELAIGSTYHFVLASSENSSDVFTTIQNSFSGGVLAFDTAACPTGWSDYTAANGRAILGAGSGNTDSLGSPLTPRTNGATGGLEYTTGIPACSLPGTIAIPSAGNIRAASHGVGISTGIYADAALMDSSIAGNTLDANLPPFIALKLCEKD